MSEFCAKATKTQKGQETPNFFSSDIWAYTRPCMATYGCVSFTYLGRSEDAHGHVRTCLFSVFGPIQDLDLSVWAYTLMNTRSCEESSKRAIFIDFCGILLYTRLGSRRLETRSLRPRVIYSLFQYII